MNWINTNQSLPICFQSGGWDGLMSNLCVVQTRYGTYHLANLYDYGDGEMSWVDQDGYEIEITDVLKWACVEE